MGSGSVNFDRAAGYYDGTREISEESERQVTALVAREVAGRGRSLEIGVGTGRVALPLHAAGVAVAGVDISGAMVARLVEKARGAVPFPLALADATRLPFADATFGAGIASHVLHLIPPWREAAAELVRVIRPGGVVLAALTTGSLNPLSELQDRFVAAAGVERMHLGVQGWNDLDAGFAELGAAVRPLPPIQEDHEVPPAAVIGRYERGEFSWAWRIPDEVRRRAATEVAAWAEGQFGSLTARVPVTRVITWRAYDLPGR